MDPRLAPAQRAHPRAALLADLVARRSDPLEALQQIAAIHAGEGESLRPLRKNWRAAGETLFADPADLPVMLLTLMAKCEELFAHCQSPHDDLLVASFAVVMLLKIHPFASRNGRTAVDFAQLLLMARWESDLPPLPASDRDHEVIGRIAASLGPDNDGHSPEALEGYRNYISETLVHSNLESLADTASLRVIADWWAEGLAGSS